MAIRVNVGGSRKVSQDYNSHGYSLSVDAELPNDSLSDPDRLAGQVNDLFQLVEDLLDQQVHQRHGLKGNGKSANGNGTPPKNENRKSESSHRSSPGNGHNTNRPATAAQTRAIRNMARRLKQDADEWASSEFGLKVCELGIGQASQLIDIFKQEIEANQRGNG